ncbi:hypothetical protein NE237_029090 [Protea cynaroides]|uniref:Calcium uniporter protein C-terminal domain-containing protein n=1 Tax=Protea cynaroides TaxID=273540 RepID=A0A9Q0GR70_9MAGN|nr:hypothetical protein NE237_029090 [Protea cynaroides]
MLAGFVGILQVAKAIEAINPISMAHPTDSRRKELEEKVAIDEQADSLVQRELWAGLGFLVVYTAAFMKLTFWELGCDGADMLQCDVRLLHGRLYLLPEDFQGSFNLRGSTRDVLLPSRSG